ncbi:hypothetical protein G6L91_11505 [Agrobacterium rhizogenes]|uniref:hypothetical protein n=1 Tax=Rhizobium rhizogenes TaxID=359 RepID=UPI001571C319|nr:hypothetical protein [Rhizobium rhizogenes]NTF62093.1 hypothetical protein [Rhizobium rhizogenes]
MSVKKAPVSSAQLRQQKREAEYRLDSLRQDQVDALEEGRAFEHNSEIVEIIERIAALDKAIARAEAREDGERARQALVDAREKAESLAIQISEAEVKRLDTVAEMQVALDEVFRIRASIIEQGKTVAALNVEAQRLVADQPAAFRRLKHFDYKVSTDSQLVGFQAIDRLNKFMTDAIEIVRRGDLPRQNWREIEKMGPSNSIWNGTLLELNHVANAIPKDGVIEAPADGE